MDGKSILIGFCLVAFAVSATAQTVTGSGTTNIVPVFTGSSTVGNSPISVSGGKVGIGTTSPQVPFEVVGTVSASDGQMGAYLISNQGAADDYSQGLGANAYFSGTNWIFPTDGANNAGSLILANEGSGALNFYTVPSSGSSAQSISNANLATYQRMVITNSGNVGIGTTKPGAALEVKGNVKLTAGSGASITFQDGTVQSSAYTGVLPGGDYADSVDVSGDRKKYEAGDLLVIDPAHPGKFLKSAEPYSTSVAGIFSTKPGTVGRRQTGPKNPDEVPMAMVGIVPAKVSAENGPIRAGDLLVTASKPGYAMKGTDRNRMLGAIVGKALGRLDSGTGVIDVVVTLQ